MQAQTSYTHTFKKDDLGTSESPATEANLSGANWTITIDELERRTGIDFFCNLPDKIENDVESKLDLKYWNITKSDQ